MIRRRLSTTATALLFLVALASTTVSSSTSAQAVSRVLQQDYTPYPVNTPVFWNFPNDGGWWSGKILSYDANTEMYSVEWEDASVEYYDNIDQVDKMVANANNDPNFNGLNDVPQYVAGTEISMKEDGVWYDGVVVEYDSDSQLYTVRWSHTNGETEQIAPGAVLDQMVADAQLNDDQLTDDAVVDGGAHAVPEDSACLYSVGTPVSYWDTEDQEWYDGSIVKCVGTDGFRPTTYEVQWPPEASDNGSAEIEEIMDPDVINQLVQDATDDDDLPPDGYPEGTMVYKDFFGEGWWIGEVVQYNNGVYTVRWVDDQSVDTFQAGEEMDAMVEDAKYIPNTDDDGTIKNGPDRPTEPVPTEPAPTEPVPTEPVEPQPAPVPVPATTVTASSSKNSKSPAAAAFLSIFVLAVVGALGYAGFRATTKRQKRQDTSALEGPIEDANISYRDEPDKLPKII